jgi:hypothetical protein
MKMSVRTGGLPGNDEFQDHRPQESVKLGASSCKADMFIEENGFLTATVGTQDRFQTLQSKFFASFSPARLRAQYSRIRYTKDNSLLSLNRHRPLYAGMDIIYS